MRMTWALPAVAIKTGGRGGRVRRSDGRGAGLGGVRTFACGVDRGDDIEVSRAVGEAGVVKFVAVGERDLRVRSAAGGAALHVIARGACAGGPSEAHLRIAGRGHGVRLARREACAGAVGLALTSEELALSPAELTADDYVEIGGAVCQAGVGEARRGGRRNLVCTGRRWWWRA